VFVVSALNELRASNVRVEILLSVWISWNSDGRIRNSDLYPINRPDVEIFKKNSQSLTGHKDMIFINRHTNIVSQKSSWFENSS